MTTLLSQKALTPKPGRKVDIDIGILMPNDVTNILLDKSSSELKKLAPTDLAAMLRVYGYTGPPDQMSDSCYVPKNLLLHIAEQICPHPLCKDCECEPPSNERTDCQFYQHGFCLARTKDNQPLTLEELDSMTGKTVWWEDFCGGLCFVKNGYILNPNGASFSNEWVVEHGRVYRHKPPVTFVTRKDEDL